MDLIQVEKKGFGLKKGAKDLWLFTMRFPYGTGEPFIGNELPYLAERFRRVLIFPLFRAEGERSVPDNVEVVDLFEDPYATASPVHVLKEISIWKRVKANVSEHAPSKELFRKQWPMLRSRLRQALHRARLLRSRMVDDHDPDRIVLYSYWNYDWALVLSILRMKNERIRFVTRMLGFDMYRFRAPDGWPAFRELQLMHAERNYIISRAGMEHMLEHYPAFSTQYRLAYLGSEDHGVGPFEPSETLRIVSCANMVALKRIDLLVRALGLIGWTVEWTHFGDGPERASIEEACKELPPNVEVDLKGNTLNKDVIAWYQRNPVDVFVHTSSTEGGVPVALQEAASFGIPLIGSDAGGVGEIVNEKTGILLKHDLSPQDLANAIVRLKDTSDESMRERVRSYWSENFKAENVYQAFADELIGE